MYKVCTLKTTWQRIVSYEPWKVDDNFLRFIFDDGLELILPKSEIISIEKVK